tara:strand:+ start:1301 stop:1624 length:324 start_codon:yes stop_codon:yes gene_type:complete
MAGGEYKRHIGDDLVPQLLEHNQTLNTSVAELTTAVAVIVTKLDIVHSSICRGRKEDEVLSKRVTTLERRSYIGAGMWAASSAAASLFFYNYGHKLIALITKGLPNA